MIIKPRTASEHYAIALLNKLLNEFGISATCTIAYPLKYSEVRRGANGDIEIRLSAQQLVRVADDGFLEYYRLRKYVPRVWYGQQAVHQLVLHEFAHVLALAHDNIHIHDQHFVKWYVKVMHQFPNGR